MSTTHTVKILNTAYITPKVRCFVVEKPPGYEFKPGQATNVAIAKNGWKDADRPFTMTSLNNDPCLEFTIKIYPERNGVTDRLTQLQTGDKLIIEDPWGAIEYKGPGLFIAGGAGLTPMIAILRQLHADNKLQGNQLIYSDSTEQTLIHGCELKRMLGENCHFILSESNTAERRTKQIDTDFIKAQIKSVEQYFYVCGPPEMMADVLDM